ncbi:dipeptide epimerase [Rhodopirellula sp. MGV]|uniref:dipeptide epimerase n=1 Tax=Rhodopirellula sp. MGV TaxID=2023130 RepID=UPI000B9738EE|nr:dipeptide epimerase [Rhodopirellula sp. MGV]OYP34735.1 dipeptide epimerase [Rhodopirellula sp. MGV]PNY34310.1 dipeptide epimerase [Rhodopirellula baltica]
MKVQLHPVELPLEYEFTIARGSINVQRSLIVELEHEGVHGFGEVTENPYYGHTIESMSESIQKQLPMIESNTFTAPDQLWTQLFPKFKKDLFALSAIDLAAYDLAGKLSGRWTYEILDLSWDQIPDSSYTIGIDSIETMLAKLNAHPGWSHYKIKLGTDHDVDIIRALRDHSIATFRIDANCGWTAKQTVKNSVALKELGVEFIEQPLPADASDDDHQFVYKNAALPIVADESCQVEADVERCAGRFHGVNVKLCKCGGLTPAVRMLKQAKSLGLKTMVGCMVESSVGISGAAQLAPLLDYADLDGAVLIAKDVAEGVEIDCGKIKLSGRFGSGIEFLTGPKPGAWETVESDE